MSEEGVFNEAQEERAIPFDIDYWDGGGCGTDNSSYVDWSVFAPDWESEADSVYDHYLDEEFA